MDITYDPSIALRMAELRQADVRAAFPRRPRRSWWSRAIAGPSQSSAPAARTGELRVPAQRTSQRESVSA